ncbi:MAG: 4Fe-4S dicluster domain-containing protein [Alphaproteobacteria bacterium]
MPDADVVVLTPDALQHILSALRARGYALVGPTIRDGAIVYDDIEATSDLPCGWTDEQNPASYRLVKRSDCAYFGYAVGPQSWKQFLHPPRQLLWQATRSGDEVEIEASPPVDKPFAFIGVRACELNAIAIQDRVLRVGSHIDPHYAKRRAGNFIVAVNCGTAGGTCFCVSMQTGPAARDGFDIALTEIVGHGEHRLLAEAGSEAGREMLAQVPSRAATDDDLTAGDAVLSETAAAMGREMAADGVRELLLGNLDHPRWDDVAARCLACGNCTMVCPTCFCTSTEDASDLAGVQTSRTRRWDSCFTLDFSYLHGGSVRSGTSSRYRQWMTHKLATWHDQFGTSGCVGCGRCITWCPVGIDITEEVRAIADSEPG